MKSLRRFIASSLLFFIINSVVSLAFARDPKTMDLERDARYIQSIGLNNPENAPRFNMAIVAYDNPTLPRSRNLTSRSDIMMVVSFDRARRKIDILSVGRDYQPSPSCWHRATSAGLYNKREKPVAGSSKINAASILYGRKVMLHCLKTVFGDFIQNSPFHSDFNLQGNALPIHALFEAKRGKNADGGMLAQLSSFSTLVSLGWIYSDSIGTLRTISGRYKLIFNGLKRRDYPAGSYQRAFNNAKFIADAIGWGAEGVQYTEENGFNFLESDILSGLDEAFSSTMSLADLNKHLTYYNDRLEPVDNMLRYGAFYQRTFEDMGPKIITPLNNGKNPYHADDPISPVRVIQIGSQLSSYGVYKDGVLDLTNASSRGYLRKLEVRPVLHLPGNTLPVCPDCHIAPDLPTGSWGPSTILNQQ